MTPSPSSATLGSRFEEAFRLARELHDGQLRKGTQIPYLSHPMAVAALVLEHGGGEDEAVAALLHDGPEDGGGEPALREIGSLFGPRVGAIVAACSDTFESPKPPWRARKERHLSKLGHELAGPYGESIRLVVAADKTHNAHAIRRDLDAVGQALWSRFRAGKQDEILWYYRSMHGTLAHGAPGGGHPIGRLLARLDEEIRFVEAAGAAGR